MTTALDYHFLQVPLLPELSQRDALGLVLKSRILPITLLSRLSAG